MTPRSRGYGDVTAMYIRRSEIPSRIYAKHQYMQESECESTVVVHFPIEKYKYMVVGPKAYHSSFDDDQLM